MSELNVFELPVFADANIFPMIPSDELAELADDIKENGLNEPLVVGKVNGEWMLIDGRNRLAACKLAGITPSYRVVDADAEKLKSLVWSWNGPRRHLSSSQKAMAYAMMYPDGEKGGRGKKLSQFCESLSPTEANNISRARFILKHNKEKADLVRDGHPDYPLSKTYDAVKAEAEQRKQQAEIERKKLEQLTELRGHYPDLASLVDEGRIYLDEALETAASRDRKAQEEAERIQREAAEKKRLEEEAKRAAMAEEERKIKEEQEKERYLYEADRATFTAWLKDMYHSSIIADTAPAKIETFKGEWDWFEGKTGIKYGDLKQRLNNLQAAIPDLLQLIESMHHV